MAEKLLEKETIDLSDIIDCLGDRPFPLEEFMKEYLDQINLRKIQEEVERKKKAEVEKQKEEEEIKKKEEEVQLEEEEEKVKPVLAAKETEIKEEVIVK